MKNMITKIINNNGSRDKNHTYDLDVPRSIPIGEADLKNQEVFILMVHFP